MTPLHFYEEQIKKGVIQEDLSQRPIIEIIDRLFNDLKAEHGLMGILRSSLMRLIGLKQTPVKGLYLWGGVGRGKTFLMDILYNLYPYDDKTRLHFHRFMQYVHQMLNDYQGHQNPLKKI